MSKFLANVFIVAVLVLSNIAVMIYGWGVSPRSWWWIIGVGFFVNVFVHAMWRILEKEKND